MTLTTGSGHTLHVSSTLPSAFDAASYAAISDWEITACVNEVPEIKVAYDLVTFDCLFSGAQETARGIAQAISWDVAFRDAATAGMAIIKAAFEAANGSGADDISIKLVDPSGNDKFFAQAKVMSKGYSSFTVGDVVMRLHDLSIGAASYVEA